MPRKSSRNAQGNGSIRQRKNGSWEARFTIGKDPGTGKQVQKSVYGATQAEVRKKLAKCIQEIDEGVFTEASRMTVAQWLDIWTGEYLNDVKPSTKAKYQAQVRVHIKPALGAILLQKLTSPMIQKFYNDESHKGLSPKTMRSIHGVLHKAMEQAKQTGYVRINPCDACTLPRLEKREMCTITGNYLKSFLSELETDPLGSLMFVTLFTGMRMSEVMGLSWDCIDYKKNQITVYRQLACVREAQGSNVYMFTSPKNGQKRVIRPAKNVFDELVKVQRKQAAWRLRAGVAWSNADNLVFTNEIGEHLSARSVYNAFKRIAKAIGLPQARFHDLRHTFATLSIQNGDDIKTVSENLGHATVAFTLDVYGHVTDKMKEQSAARMEHFLDSL